MIFFFKAQNSGIRIKYSYLVLHHFKIFEGQYQGNNVSKNVYKVCFLEVLGTYKHIFVLFCVDNIANKSLFFP